LRQPRHCFGKLVNLADGRATAHRILCVALRIKGIERSVSPPYPADDLTHTRRAVTSPEITAQRREQLQLNAIADDGRSTLHQWSLRSSDLNRPHRLF